jgi:hypothetical protein
MPSEVPVHIESELELESESKSSVKASADFEHFFLNASESLVDSIGPPDQ